MRFIDELCERIVCPTKIRYSIYDLGNKQSNFGKRSDFQVYNYQKQQIRGSFYQCGNQAQEERICVLYLHSMNGSRLQSVGYIEQILKKGLYFCHFDFAGCGNSQGSSISFGANEKYDVLAVFQHLKEKFKIKKFILWGRSMGSACAIKFCELLKDTYQKNADKQVIGVILDSCFRSFSKLIVEIAHNYTQYPQLLLKAGYFLVKGTIEQKGNFKISDLQLCEIVDQLKVPVLFLTSKDDITVKSEHSQILYSLYGCKQKRLCYFKGMHNQSRDTDYLREVKKFLHQLLKANRNSNLEFKELKESRFQKLMGNQRNFIVERDQNYNATQGCYCSLFSYQKLSTNSHSQSFQNLQERKPKTQSLSDRQKIKLSKFAIQSPKQFKSHSRYNQKYFK